MTAEVENNSVTLKGAWAVWIAVLLSVASFIRPMVTDSDGSPTKQEVKEMIASELRPFQVTLDNNSKSIDRIESKVDRLLQRNYAYKAR